MTSYNNRMARNRKRKAKRHVGPRTKEQRREDVSKGVDRGMQFAGGFSLIATVLAIITVASEGDLLEGLLALVLLIVFYFAIGAAGGALYGWMRPIQDRYWGKFLTAYLIVFLVYGGGTIAFWPLLEDMRQVPLAWLLGAWAILSIVLAPAYVAVAKRI